MFIFKLAADDPTQRLYIGTTEPGEQGHIAYILHRRIQERELTLLDALTKHSGSFLFLYEPLTDKMNTERFVQQVTDFMRTLASRALLWLKDVKNIQINTVSVLLINEAGKKTISELNAFLISEDCRFWIGENLSIQLSGDTLMLKSRNDRRIGFKGRMAPLSIPVREASIPFTGAQRGCIQIEELFIKRYSLSKKMRTGFQFAFSANSQHKMNHEGDCINVRPGNMKYGFYSLLDSVKYKDDYIGFQMSLDLCDVTNFSVDNRHWGNLRTFLAFTGRNNTVRGADQESTLLYTNYITRLGYPVELRPVVADTDDEQQAMLLFTETAEKGVMLRPAGDFSLSVMEGIGGEEYELLCGLSATEIIRFQPGHRIRFTNGPAYAKSYPFSKSSTVGPPLVPPTNLLQNQLLTAWMQVVPVHTYWTERTLPPLQYMAQPIDATLYGEGELSSNTGNLFFDFKDTTSPLDETSAPFPLLPYSAIEMTNEEGGFKKEDYKCIEKDIMAPLRRGYIRIKQDLSTHFLENGCSIDTYDATTPSGQLVALSGGQYIKVLLGRSESSNESEADISFVNLTEKLNQALQSNQLFLVIANAKWIGEEGGGNGRGPGFCNTTEMDSWGFSVNTGKQNSYMDYNNIVIIKGRTGPGNSLKELVSKPEVWTQAVDFASPTYSVTESPEPNDITALSNWLQNYIDKSDPDKDPTYESFNQLVTNEEWTGFLILNANLTKYPKEVQDFLKGINNQELRAHHLGADTRASSKELKPTDSSAMFGLVYYVHPAYDPSSERTTIKPRPGDYDFQALLMRASFVNGKLADFQARAQLTMCRFFHHKVEKMGKEGQKDCTMMIEGSIQKDNEQIIYVFKPSEKYVYIFNDNVLERVEITGIDLYSERYGLSGFLAFHPLVLKNGVESEEFDVFSFGADSTILREEARGKGLAFSKIYIESSPAGLLQFEPHQINFDLNRSSPRLDSLYRAFPLQLQGLLVDDGTGNLESHGYLQVGAGGQLIGIEGKPWHGLRFILNFGSLGTLSGNAVFQAELLLAWSPMDNSDRGSYNVAIGLKLPNALKQFNLQGVMQLSFDHILLRKEKHREHGLFVLHLNSVLLKFLGLQQIPPNGAAALHLFGDPEGNSTDSHSEMGWYGIYKTEERLE
ncbi:hypothetical protein [Bacillus cereus]|uniref:hypothetical protein n=1 Tax=Bacillus cereus TaxID=1396 RepID=UPI00397EFA8D